MSSPAAAGGDASQRKDSHTTTGGSPFHYLQASPCHSTGMSQDRSYATARPFQDLELLLPASLWSPSFVVERSYYTLAPHPRYVGNGGEAAPRRPGPPLATSPSRSTAGGGTSTDRAEEAEKSEGGRGVSCTSSLSSPRVSCSLAVTPAKASSALRAATPPPRALRPHRDAAGDEKGGEEPFEKAHDSAVHAPTPPASPSRWSLIGMQRSFLLAHYPNGMGFAATPGGRSSCFPTPPPAAKRDSAGRSEEGEEAPVDEEAEERSFVLVASDSESDGEGKDENERHDRNRRAGRELLYDEELPHDTIPFSGATTCAPVLAAVDEDALSAALDALESVLRRVRELHFCECPLCAPTLAPTWFNHEGRRKRTRHDSAKEGGTALRLADDNEGGSGGAGPSPISLDCPCGLEERRLQLLQRANEFLSYQRSRVEYLHSTRPVMYATVAEHELVHQCRSMGGIALLEALLVALQRAP